MEMGRILAGASGPFARPINEIPKVAFSELVASLEREPRGATRRTATRTSSGPLETGSLTKTA